MATNFFKLTYRKRRIIEGQGKKIVCAKCGYDLYDDEDVVSTSTASTVGRSYKLYHRACYEDMFI